jgi:hypothetical protein
MPAVHSLLFLGRIRNYTSACGGMQFPVVEIESFHSRKPIAKVIGLMGEMFQICCDTDRCGVNYRQRCLYGSFRYSV